MATVKPSAQASNLRTAVLTATGLSASGYRDAYGLRNGPGG
jgi:hypothetical protein